LRCIWHRNEGDLALRGDVVDKSPGLSRGDSCCPDGYIDESSEKLELEHELELRFNIEWMDTHEPELELESEFSSLDDVFSCASDRGKS